MNHAYFNHILHLLAQRPQQGKRLIGLGEHAFWELWQRVEELDKVAQQQRAEDPKRQRQVGGGVKKSANVVSRLLVCLLYLRFSLDDAGIGRDALVVAKPRCGTTSMKCYLLCGKHCLRVCWSNCLQECPSLERSELEAWLAELPDGALLVDSWSQPIPRPSDEQSQKQHYSGKQKEHTCKNQAITLPKGIDKRGCSHRGAGTP